MARLQTLEMTSGGAHKNQTSWNFNLYIITISSTLEMFQHLHCGCSSELWAYAGYFSIYTVTIFSTLLLKGSSIWRIFFSLNPCNCDHLPCRARQWNSKRDWPCNFKTQLIFLLMLWLFLVKFMHFTVLETGSLYGTRIENNL